jgi:predicted HNH restriction endonuclease
MVIQRHGVMGYYFSRHGRNADACPEHLAEDLIRYFSECYNCEPSAFIVHKGAGSNNGCTYLIFRDPQVALRILLLDSGEEVDQEVQVTSINERFVEGRLVDVVMQRRERNEAARTACLAVYGYNCVVCGINLKARYAGLPIEVIHVHHEEPLSQSDGERGFDPVATMKPVCPNCHAVIHSRNPPYPISEVKQMVTGVT